MVNLENEQVICDTEDDAEENLNNFNKVLNYHVFGVVQHFLRLLARSKSLFVCADLSIFDVKHYPHYKY